MIRLNNDFLKGFNFKVGDIIKVNYEENKIIIEK